MGTVLLVIVLGVLGETVKGGDASDKNIVPSSGPAKAFTVVTLADVAKKELSQCIYDFGGGRKLSAPLLRESSCTLSPLDPRFATSGIFTPVSIRGESEGEVLANFVYYEICSHSSQQECVRFDEWRLDLENNKLLLVGRRLGWLPGARA